MKVRAISEFELDTITIRITRTLNSKSELGHHLLSVETKGDVLIRWEDIETLVDMALTVERDNKGKYPLRKNLEGILKEAAKKESI